MARTKHDEMAELTGAFALDALEPEEREAMDRHLRNCPKCRAEVSDHRETAAMLAHSGVDAPPNLWEKLVASLDEAPPAGIAPILNFAPPSSNSRRSRMTIGAIAAAAALVVALNGAVLVRQQGEMRDLRAQNASQADLESVALAAAADPLARVARLRSEDGSHTANAVVLPDGRGYLIRHDLPALGADRTYQLWAVVPGAPNPVSLGVLGSSPRVAAFAVSGPVSALAISVEQAGGVVVSATKPVLVGELNRA